MESDRVKARSFRDERVPLLSRLGEVDHLVRKYDWAVETGAVEVVEMMEKMAREKAEDRRRQIAVEARGMFGVLTVLDILAAVSTWIMVQNSKRIILKKFQEDWE